MTSPADDDATGQYDDLRESSGPGLTFADLWAILLRRWKVSLLACMATVVVVFLALTRVTPLYEARAIITVDNGLKALDFQTNADTERIELNMLNTVRDQLIAMPVLRETIIVTGLASSPDYASAFDPVMILKERVKANTIKDSQSIMLTLRDEYPERAQSALNTLIAVYKSQLSAAKDDKSQSALVFLRAKRDEELAKLEASRAAETDLMNKAGIISNNPETDLMSRRLVELNSQLVRVDSWIAAGSVAREQLLAVKALPEAERLNALLAVDAIARDPAVSDQVRQVALLEAEVGGLEEKFGNLHPKLIEARGRLVKQRELLRTSAEAAMTSALMVQQGPLRNAEELKLMIADQEQRLKQRRNDLLALSALAEVTDSHSKLYQTILTRLNEMEVDSSLNERATKVIDPPSVSYSPVNTGRLMLLGIPLLCGALAAIAVALAADVMDAGIYGIRQIQRISGLALIGKIPQDARLETSGHTKGAAEPQHLSEAFRMIRASIRMAQRQRAGCERIALVSCAVGEGKSTIAVRLAQSLASMGARVLLIDADMRKPTQDEQLGLRTTEGLSSLLAGMPGISPVASASPGLDYLGVGMLPINPGEQLLSPLLPEALDEFSRSYDYILIDTPPLSVVADSLSIAEHVDDIVLILRNGYTDKHTLRLVMERVGPMKGKIMGFILNGDNAVPAAYYGREEPDV